MEKFDQFFSLSDDDMQAFIAAGEKEKVAFNEEQYATSKEVFKCYLKGLIARDLYTEDNAFNIIVNHRNRDLQEALRLINDTSRYQSLLLTGNTEYEKIAARHKAAAQKSTNK